MRYLSVHFVLSYELHAQLGEGTFGKVLHATWTPPPGSSTPGPVDVALKVIAKKKVKGNESLVFSGVFKTPPFPGGNDVTDADPLMLQKWLF